MGSGVVATKVRTLKTLKIKSLIDMVKFTYLVLMVMVPTKFL